MKNLLLVVNCILGIAVFAMFVSNVASLDSKKENYEVKKRSGSKNSAGEPEKRSKLVIAPEKQLETIVNSDIFNPERAPNVAAWGRGRTQISLVGTFKVGKVEGAIILQQVSQRFRTPANTMGAMMTQDAMMSMMNQVIRMQ